MTLLPPPPSIIQRLADSLRYFWVNFKMLTPPPPLEKILRTPLVIWDVVQNPPRSLSLCAHPWDALRNHVVFEKGVVVVAIGTFRFAWTDTWYFHSRQCFNRTSIVA